MNGHKGPRGHRGAYGPRECPGCGAKDSRQWNKETDREQCTICGWDGCNATLDNGERVTILFLCDPSKNTECNKTGCREWCTHTVNEKFRLALEDGYIYENYRHEEADGCR